MVFQAQGCGQVEGTSKILHLKTLASVTSIFYPVSEVFCDLLPLLCVFQFLSPQATCPSARCLLSRSSRAGHFQTTALRSVRECCCVIAVVLFVDALFVGCVILSVSCSSTKLQRSTTCIDFSLCSSGHVPARSAISSIPPTRATADGMLCPVSIATLHSLVAHLLPVAYPLSSHFFGPRCCWFRFLHSVAFDTYAIRCIVRCWNDLSIRRPCKHAASSTRSSFSPRSCLPIAFPSHAVP
jgi:hypothetical protein